MRGRFVTFEGGDGAGKTTQLARVAALLRELGIAVVETREPGGTDGAEMIRELILSGKARELGPDAETLLFAAARIDHIDSVIRPALLSGKWVLCDRFIDSTWVYQGGPEVISARAQTGDGGDAGTRQGNFINALEKIAIADMRPDRTYLIDVPPAEAARRINARADGGGGPRDRFENDDLAIGDQRREAFISLAEREPERIMVVDGMRSADAIHAQIAADITNRFDMFFPENTRNKRARGQLHNAGAEQ